MIAETLNAMQTFKQPLREFSSLEMLDVVNHSLCGLLQKVAAQRLQLMHI
jgi:hypothetical protein